MSTSYDDIIDLPHHVSEKHAQMPVCDRAAQFSPFAALTGYDAAIAETARQTGERIELADSRREAINDCLVLIAEHIREKPEVMITHFVLDKKKSGGAYIDTVGNVKKIDEIERMVILDSGEKILIDDIIGVDVMGM